MAKPYEVICRECDWSTIVSFSAQDVVDTLIHGKCLECGSEYIAISRIRDNRRR